MYMFISIHILFKYSSLFHQPVFFSINLSIGPSIYLLNINTLFRQVDKIVVGLGKELQDMKDCLLSVMEIYTKRLSTNKAVRQV